MIRVKNLRKTFGATIAVDGVSFEVREGEVVGFLGPNGAGKSTTMRLLTTFLDPDEGEIEIGGINALQDPVAARTRLGYLPESAPLYEELGVVESLRYTARIRGLSAQRTRQRIDEMVESCGLSGVVKKDIAELSKGYRQRVGLAQTLLHDPDFLVLDEPTTGLDPNQIQEIRSLIREIGKRRTIILSTHILPEVQATCSRALIINEGRIVADDQPDRLVSSSSRSEGFRFHMILTGADRSAVVSALGKMENVAEIEDVNEADGAIQLTLRGEGSSLGDQLFQKAVAEGWVLRELRPEQLSLEQVFSRLTRGEEGEA